MRQYTKELLNECPNELIKGTSSTPAAAYLFGINKDSTKLTDDQAILYNHLISKALYLFKCAWPYLQLDVSFLTNRLQVQAPDVEDYKNPGRCLRYLRDSKELPLTLECSNIKNIWWWADASFAIHPNLRSHNGAIMDPQWWLDADRFTPHI